VELLKVEPGTTKVPPETKIPCENLVSVLLEYKTLDFLDLTTNIFLCARGSFFTGGGGGGGGL